jgi:serine/threonine-protein kinase HipA
MGEIDGVNVHVGQLYSHRRRNVESASFTYDPAYLADPRAYALDPGLPLVSGTLQTPANQPIFGACSDSCPVRWGQRLIERYEARRIDRDGGTARTFGKFNLLLRLRDDLRQGAIRYAVHEPFCRRRDGRARHDRPADAADNVLIGVRPPPCR